MNIEPRVAVCIPTYNAHGTLERAIDSALAQTAVCRVIVVDDCSTDDTARVLEKYSEDSRVTVIFLPENAGPAHARNVAFQAAEEPWIALLDSDDFMESDRIERLLEIASEGDWDFVADNLYRVNEGDLEGERRTLWKDAYSSGHHLTLEEFVRANLSVGRGEERVELAFVKPLMKRAFLLQHGLSYNESMRLGEDYDLYASALAKGARFCLVDAKGYIAVERASSLSGQHSTKDLGDFYAADTRLLALDGLSAPEREVVREHQLDTHKRWAWRRFLDAKKKRDFKALFGLLVVPPSVLFYMFREAMAVSLSRLREKIG